MGWDALIGPALTAAVVSALVGIIVALINRSTVLTTSQKRVLADRDALDRKINAELDLAVKRITADQDKITSEQAWADYGLRRDMYLDMSKQISALFTGGNATIKEELLATSRKVRLIGSDEVVVALNEMTSAIKDGESSDVTDAKFRTLFRVMRQDIRSLHLKPPEGTALGDEAFPIES